MKVLHHILASLTLVLVGGQGGLRPSSETTAAIDGRDAMRLLHDSEGNHRHGLHNNPHHHLVETDDAHHVSLHRNLTNSNDMMFSTSSNCGDGTCSESESVRGCRADCGNLKIQAATMGKRGASGVMFYVRARRDIAITSLDFFSGTRSENEIVQVYTRSGEYPGFELNSNGWQIVYDNDSVDLLGGNKVTELGNFDKRVTILEGNIQSFFIWTPNNRIRYRIGTSEGAGYSANSMIAFYEGAGVTSKFSGSYAANVLPARVFTGAIRYDAISLSSIGGDPLTSGIPITLKSACLENQRRVKIGLKTDPYGYETSYSFTKKGSGNPIAAGPEIGKYESDTVYSGMICAPVGLYTFQISDLFKDGMSSGYYSISVQNSDGSWKNPVRGGGKFGSSKKHVIDVGLQESKMTTRDKGYLDSHNKRRKEWHARYNKDYVPLRWSNGLKEHAMPYAIKLLETCQTESPKHDPNNPYGENIARNQGGGSWGQKYPPDNILNRFVEHEEGLPWARNGHLTNALWRATKYVGCAEAEKSYQVTTRNGNKVTHNCRAQVCRYAKPGNCSMGKYKRSNGVYDWETPMVMDDSPCEPACPPEGCYDE